MLIDGCKQFLFLVRRETPVPTGPGAGRRIFVTGLTGSPTPHSFIAVVNM